MNLCRHLPTVAFDQSRRSAISEFESPSPDHNTSFARDTSACERLREAANPSSAPDADVIGQAIAGALYQAACESHRSGRSREELVKNLTAFLTRALRPD